MSARSRFTILMNPNSAGGKAQRLLPEVKAVLGAARRRRTSSRPGTSPHAAEAARAAADRGETVVALGGDGLVGALAATLKGSAPLGVLPGGARQRFARALGISPGDRIRLPDPARRLGARARPRRGERPRVRMHRLGRLRFRRQPDGERGAFRPREPRLRVGRDPGPDRVAARALPGDPRRPELEFEGYTVAVANSPYYGGGMRVAPAADPADGLLDVIFVKQTSKLSLPANLPKVFAGTHVQLDGIEPHRAAEVDDPREPVLRRLRRRRADHDASRHRQVAPGAFRVIVPRRLNAPVLAHAKAGRHDREGHRGGLRISRRGGGTSLPGKLLLRLEPKAIAELGPGSSAVGRRQRDERKDHDCAA